MPASGSLIRACVPTEDGRISEIDREQRYGGEFKKQPAVPPDKSSLHIVSNLTNSFRCPSFLWLPRIDFRLKIRWRSRHALHLTVAPGMSAPPFLSQSLHSGALHPSKRSGHLLERKRRAFRCAHVASSVQVDGRARLSLPYAEAGPPLLLSSRFTEAS